MWRAPRAGRSEKLELNNMGFTSWFQTSRGEYCNARATNEFFQAVKQLTWASRGSGHPRAVLSVNTSLSNDREPDKQRKPGIGRKILITVIEAFPKARNAGSGTHAGNLVRSRIQTSQFWPRRNRLPRTLRQRASDCVSAAIRRCGNLPSGREFRAIRCATWGS